MMEPVRNSPEASSPGPDHKRQRALRRVPCRWPITLLFASLQGQACSSTDPEPKDTTEPNSCLTEGRDGVLEVLLDPVAEGEELRVQVNYTRKKLLSDGAPVVVVTQGGFNWPAVPAEGHAIAIHRDVGIIQVYPDLAHGDEPFDESPDGDWRGDKSREILARVIRFVSGLESDIDGCLLSEMLPVKISSVPPVLHGQSNGGNVLTATLADPALELPPVTGLSTFETPPSSQFITVEFGSLAVMNPEYEPGSCVWEAKTGLTCAIDYSLLRWSPETTRYDGVVGALYFDIDKDGLLASSLDYPIWGQRPLIDGAERIAFSTPLTQAIDLMGLETAARMGADEANEFWRFREATRQAANAIERFPELKVLVIGTDIDHVLSAADHPHVSGLVAAFEGAGAPWVRLNPDATYVELISSTKGDFSDNPANMGLLPGDTRVRFEPDHKEGGPANVDYVTAAVVELFQRAEADDWSSNLDEPLESIAR